MDGQLLTTAEQDHALKIAKGLIEAGIAVFAAPPCKGSRCRLDGRGGEIGRDGFPGGRALILSGAPNTEGRYAGQALTRGGRARDPDTTGCGKWTRTTGERTDKTLPRGPSSRRTHERVT